MTFHPILGDGASDAEPNHALAREWMPSRSMVFPLNRRNAVRKWPRTRYRRQMDRRFRRKPRGSRHRRVYGQRWQIDNGLRTGYFTVRLCGRKTKVFETEPAATEGIDMERFSIRLEACDPEHDHFRAYRIEAGTDLLGDWLVDVTYGRIGTRGRLIRHLAADEAAARKIVRQCLQRRATAPKRIGVPYQLREISDPVGWMHVA